MPPIQRKIFFVINILLATFFAALVIRMLMANTSESCSSDIVAADISFFCIYHRLQYIALDGLLPVFSTAGMAGLLCSFPADSPHAGAEVQHLLPRKLCQRTHVTRRRPHRRFSVLFLVVCRQGLLAFLAMGSFGDIPFLDFLLIF